MRNFLLVLSLVSSNAFAGDWAISRVCNGTEAETADALLLSRTDYWPNFPGTDHLFVIKDAGVIDFFQSYNIGVPNLAFGANVKTNAWGQREMILNPWGTAAWDRTRFPDVYFVDSSHPVYVQVKPKDEGIMVEFFGEQRFGSNWTHRPVARWFFETCWDYR